MCVGDRFVVYCSLSAARVDQFLRTNRNNGYIMGDKLNATEKEYLQALYKTSINIPKLLRISVKKSKSPPAGIAEGLNLLNA